MNIEELIGQEIFYEDIEGLVFHPEGRSVRVRLSDTNSQSTLIEDIYYADNAGEVRLNYGNVVRNMLEPEIPVERGILYGPGLYDNYINLALEIKDSGSGKVYNMKAIGASADVRTKCSDIDLLYVSENSDLILNFFMNGSGMLRICVESAGILKTVKSVPVDASPGLFSYCLNVSDLPVVKGHAFRIVLRFGNDAELHSCIYKIGKGMYQEFVFAGDLGGYVYFPMSGALEFTPEVKASNGACDSGYRYVSSECSPVFKQHTGGLTRRAMAVLSNLMTSRFICHRVNGKWKRIVVEDISAGWTTAESLCYGHFSFRYAEK